MTDLHDIKYDLHDMLPQAFTPCIEVSSVSFDICNYALSALWVLAHRRRWWDCSLVLDWGVSIGHNCFFDYFAVEDGIHTFFSLDDVPDEVSCSKCPDKLSNQDLVNGRTKKYMLYRYKDVIPLKSFGDYRDVLKSNSGYLKLRYKVDNSSNGYYTSKFSNAGFTIGVDLRGFLPNRLTRLFDGLDSLVLPRVGVRIYCSYEDGVVFREVRGRYGDRVVSRKKSNNAVHDTTVECGILSRCDQLVGCDLSPVVALASVYTNSDFKSYQR
jgi:hypothetical protein